MMDTEMMENRKTQDTIKREVCPTCVGFGTIVSNDNYKSFRAWRERLGLTQAAVADELGTDVTQISRWEHGRYRFSAERLSRLVRIYVDADIAQAAKKAEAIN